MTTKKQIAVGKMTTSGTAFAFVICAASAAKTVACSVFDLCF